MASQASIDILIDASVRNYAPAAFHNMALNQILHLLNQNTGSGGSTAPPAGYFPGLFVTQANFSDATDCPIPSLNGYNLMIFYNDANRYLIKGVDWQVLVGGGFTILIPGFDATAGGFTATFALTPAAV